MPQPPGDAYEQVVRHLAGFNGVLQVEGYVARGAGPEWALSAIEDEIRGKSAFNRRTVREARTKPLVDALDAWLMEHFARLSKGSTLAREIRYRLNHWGRLCRFSNDHLVELDSTLNAADSIEQKMLCSPAVTRTPPIVQPPRR